MCVEGERESKRRCEGRLSRGRPRRRRRRLACAPRTTDYGRKEGFELMICLMARGG